MSQRLLVFQSLWGMEGLARPDRPEWSIDEKLERIAAAGFDGVEMVATTEADCDAARGLVKRLDRLGLRRSLVTFPDSIDGLGHALELGRRIGVTHVNLQGNIKVFRISEAVKCFRAWGKMAKKARLPVYFEIHRDRTTTDLFFSLRVMDKMPEIEMTADLSHCLIDREFPYPVSEENHALIRRVLDRTGNFHGRIGTNEQVQVPFHFPQHRRWVDVFLGWWEYGFRSWRVRAPRDAALVFLCELGPPDYAITGADGQELSDRWAEALDMKDMVRALWDRIEREAVERLPATLKKSRIEGDETR